MNGFYIAFGIVLQRQEPGSKIEYLCCESVHEHLEQNTIWYLPFAQRTLEKTRNW